MNFVMTLRATCVNRYLDINSTVETEAESEVPSPPGLPGSLVRRAWEWEWIFPRFTGAGRPKGDASYTVTIIESSAPGVIPVGTVYQFGVEPEPEPADRSRDVSRELTEVRTVLSRAESALAVLQDEPPRAGHWDYSTVPAVWVDEGPLIDPDRDDMIAEIEVTIARLARWRRKGPPRRPGARRKSGAW
jgi:hypothetical protein